MDYTPTHGQTPRYTHDCKSCIHIGNISINEKHYDIYWCKPSDPDNATAVADSSLLARYGDDGPYYISSNPRYITLENQPMCAALSMLFRFLGVNGSSSFIISKGEFYTSDKGLFIQMSPSIDKLQTEIYKQSIKIRKLEAAIANAIIQ